MPDDIFNKVISFIAGDSEGGSDKQVLLKQLAKEISQNKYAKFYKVRQEEADSSLAGYLYSVYKIIHPAAVFLRDPARIAQIKNITLESFLDKSMMDVIRRLSPEAVAERRKAGETNLSRSLEDDLAALAAGFDSPKLAAADKCYNLIVLFNRFARYDFYSLLKKFDPELPDLPDLPDSIEGDFSVLPKFEPIKADTIMADLAGFLSVLPFSNSREMREMEDWKTVLEIFKYCKGGTDLLSPASWANLLGSLKDIKQTKILEFIIRLASGNPVWEPKIAELPNEQLSSIWMEQKVREVRQVIAEIADSQRNVQIRALEKAVFGDAGMVRLNYYTPERGRILTQKELDGYAYAPALNHLTAFILDYLSKEIQELCEILLIRGQWTDNTASRAMSDGFHTATEIVPGISALDETLSEDGSNGPRLRGALLRVDRDRTQRRYINSIVDSVNEEALALVNEAVQSLIVVGKHFKMLLEDHQKKPSELMMNWKELSLVSKTPLLPRLAEAYKKINYFVQLMLLETRRSDE
jgi:hypothetical protein